MFSKVYFVNMLNSNGIGRKFKNYSNLGFVSSFVCLCLFVCFCTKVWHRLGTNHIFIFV